MLSLSWMTSVSWLALVNPIFKFSGEVILKRTTVFLDKGLVK